MFTEQKDYFKSAVKEALDRNVPIRVSERQLRADWDFISKMEQWQRYSGLYVGRTEPMEEYLNWIAQQANVEIVKAWSLYDYSYDIYSQSAAKIVRLENTVNNYKKELVTANAEIKQSRENLRWFKVKVELAAVFIFQAIVVGLMLIAIL